MIDLRALPKAELHLHIEGTFEPELIFAIAERNGVDPGYPSVEALRAAYEFTDLQSFLDVYYAGMNVLRTERDYYDLASAYLERAREQGVRHAEIFFDPQAHTQRGVAFDTVIEGLRRALDDASARLGISSHLIMCFLRDLSAQSAMETLEAATSASLADRCGRTRLGRIRAIRLRSSLTVFDRARAEGFFTVAHAGEEGPPSYVWEALDLLRVSRIDHGVRSLGRSATGRAPASPARPAHRLSFLQRQTARGA